MLILLWIALSAPTNAFARDEPDLLDAVYENHERWRNQYLGALRLPLGLRVHFNTSYTWHLSPSDRLASRYTGTTGPGLLKERFLESRFALSRPITNRIDLEVAWGTRNRLHVDDPMGFQRQTIGALIRFTP